MAKSSAARAGGVRKPAQERAGRGERDEPGELRPVRGRRVSDPLAPDLDRLIHERVRLGIVSALAVNASLSFNDLKRLMHTTDGNLSVHARKLEDAGYVLCEKTFEGRVPKTEYRLSATGRRALERYLDHMEVLIDATRRGT